MSWCRIKTSHLNTVNTAFVNYLANLTESLKFTNLLNRKTYEQTLPISLQSFKFDSGLLKAPKHKRLFHQFQHEKEIFERKA